MTDDGRTTFAAARRERIMELVRANGSMALRDIATQVRASEVTVRRDVRALEAEGLIDRRRGGAALPGQLGHDQSYAQMTGHNAPQKRAIAAAAARLVDDDDAIALGPGTTAEALARELVGRRNLTVVTTSLPAADVLSGAPGVEVVMPGGTLRSSIRALVGTATEQALAGLRVRRAFVTGNGVTADRGLSTPNPAVAATDRALVAAAQEAIVLADSSKVGTDTMVQTVPPEQIAHLVTDNRADPEVLMTLEDAGTLVHVAVLDTDRGE
ncbi:DeoR/GlpR family DNA-binding transcription regulator [Nocardiopsis sp. RSe5-2]|uniref:DeoR/GlpR family DNA-binding transcription regulator n=1 Tax=Nocardiopsis endophytica TaxID=3018445 RepID=A0ABT4U4C7_9ACTN|nr:DeoR/GlpR family DNA-binding transcription regulator [Nocardiopsis endophytica]MDA2811811.1 DeoR/GlpR family DNA-binding transcription regulator [Nocardiopsis endophytica]